VKHIHWPSHTGSNSTSQSPRNTPGFAEHLEWTDRITFPITILFPHALSPSPHPHGTEGAKHPSPHLWETRINSGNICITTTTTPLPQQHLLTQNQIKSNHIYYVLAAMRLD